MNLTMQLLWEEGTQRLLQAGIKEAGLDSEYLLLEAFHIDKAHFLLDRSQRLSEEGFPQEAAAHYRRMIKKRSERIPLQQITGSRSFMGLDFLVDENVLIPRQDTETLVELVLKEYKGKNPEVLDMCTGSGCIAVSLGVLGEFSGVTAADLSPKALLVAEKNAKRLYSQRFGSAAESLNGIVSVDSSAREHRITFVESDLFSAFQSGERFDVIVSNPPYIPTEVIKGLEPEVRDHEPLMALDGKEDGLFFYRRLAAESKSYLKPGGTIYFEIGYDQAEAVCGLLKEQGFEEIRVVKDLPGLDRVVSGVCI